MIKYRVYPTLLNKFADFKSGKVSEQNVLDMINHVDVPKTEWMLRGIAFHKFTAHPEQFPDIQIVDGNYKFQWWKFPKEYTDSIIEERAGGTHEVFCEREFDTGKNEVMLFCIADTLKEGIIYDLKLQGFYRGISFLQSWQHRLSLYVIPNRGFCYLITDFKGIYYEDYYKNFSKCLAVIVDELVEFLELNDNKITYERIRQGYYIDFPRVSDIERKKAGQGGR